MLKADFHLHTADDPIDSIPHSAYELIDKASALGFHALAVTLHDAQYDVAGVRDYARDRGIVLVPGVERTLHGKHVLLLNFPQEAEQIASFDALADLRRRHPEGLVVAPHPFFPHRSCLRGLLDRHEPLFDAVEVNAFYLRSIDFNRRAVRWARAHERPLVGNSDSHRLSMLGTTYSLVDAEAGSDATAICDAVRGGRVSVRTRPLAALEAAAYLAKIHSAKRKGVRSAVLAGAAEG